MRSYLGLAFLVSVCCLLLPEQRASLVNFYFATEGPSWTTDTDWFLGDPCTNSWQGIVCDTANLNVVKIVLFGNGLAGTLPDLQLPELVTL
jgi:hypothetical protein